MKRILVTFISCFALLSATVSVPALAEAKDEIDQSNASVLQSMFATVSDGIQSVIDGAKTNIAELFGASEQLAREDSEGANTSASTSAQDTEDAAVVPSNLDAVVWSADYKTCTLLAGYSVSGNDLTMEIASHRDTLTTFIAEANSKISNTGVMFSNCRSLSTVDFAPSFEASLSSADEMFANCSSLTSLTLPEGFDTSHCWNFVNMFSGCTALTSLTLPRNFATDASSQMNNMFKVTDPGSSAISLRSLTLPKGFTMKTGTGLPGLASQSDYKNYWTTSIDSCVNYGTTEAEAVENINNVLAEGADFVTFSNVNVALGFDANGGTYDTNPSKDYTQDSDEVKTLFGNTDEAINVENLPTPELSGFTCIGWSTERDGAILSTPITFPVSDDTYYAQYAEAPSPTPDPTPEPIPDVVPAADTDVLPVTGDASAALSSSLFVVLLGVLTLIASGYSLSCKRLM